MKVKTSCFGEVEILNRDWYNITNYHGVFGDCINVGCIGIVTMKDQFNNVKSYIGLGHGINEQEDTILVLDTGVPFYG